MHIFYYIYICHMFRLVAILRELATSRNMQQPYNVKCVYDTVMCALVGARRSSNQIVLLNCLSGAIFFPEDRMRCDTGHSVFCARGTFVSLARMRCDTGHSVFCARGTFMSLARMRCDTGHSVFCARGTFVCLARFLL